MPPTRLAIRFLALSMLALTSAAPASAQTAPPADKAVPDRIRKIALIPAPEPLEYVALTKTGGTAAASFGLIGALIGGAVAAAQTSENTPKMTEAMRALDARLGATLTDTLEARLRAQNLEIVRIESLAREKPHERLKDYSGIETDADAILDVVIRHVGYYRIQPTDDFGPGMRVDLRLVTAKTKQLILSDDPGYGLANNWSNKHKFDGIYVFANMDRVRQHAPIAKEGMEKGAVPIADEIAGKISEINSIGVAASMAKAKETAALSDDPDAKRNDDRGSN
jgi:hypothetical protein